MTRRKRQNVIDLMRAKVRALPPHSRKRAALLAKLVPLVTAEIKSSVRDANKVAKGE